MSDTTKPVLSDDVLKAARSRSDMMALWALCGHSGCRKAGHCRGVPPTCLDTCVERVPAAVSDFVFGLFSGKDENLSFDDALARVPQELGAEWSAWHQAVARMTGRATMKLPQPAGRNSGSRLRSPPERRVTPAATAPDALPTRSIELQPERFDDRRPERDVGGEGLAEFVGR